MQSPAYESIMAAAQHVVYDTRADVTSRVFQAIKPAIQTTKNGDQTSNSFTALLSDTRITFDQYMLELAIVANQAASMRLTYERQVALGDCHQHGRRAWV